jgi:hypothetical protein
MFTIKQNDPNGSWFAIRNDDDKVVAVAEWRDEIVEALRNIQTELIKVVDADGFELEQFNVAALCVGESRTTESGESFTRVG